jgi:hypothetical protein
MRKKRSPIGQEKAVKRLAGLKSISQDLDFGDGLTTMKFEEAINALQTKVINYNTLLSGIDEQLMNIKEMERALADFADRMLTGVATRFGKRSEEYLKAGGVTKNERKSPKRRLPSQAIQ